MNSPDICSVSLLSSCSIFNIFDDEDKEENEDEVGRFVSRNTETEGHRRWSLPEGALQRGTGIRKPPG